MTIGMERPARLWKTTGHHPPLHPNKDLLTSVSSTAGLRGNVLFSNLTTAVPIFIILRYLN